MDALFFGNNLTRFSGIISVVVARHWVTVGVQWDTRFQGFAIFMEREQRDT